jgi:hypothetical protein
MTVKRTYVGEADRVYPGLSLEPVPGQEYDLEKDSVPDDGLWQTKAAAADTTTPVTPTATAGA